MIRGSVGQRQGSSACRWNERKLGVEGTLSQGALRVSCPPESEWTKHPLDPYQASRGLSGGSVRGQLGYLQSMQRRRGC